MEGDYAGRYAPSGGNEGQSDTKRGWPSLDAILGKAIRSSRRHQDAPSKGEQDDRFARDAIYGHVGNANLADTHISRRPGSPVPEKRRGKKEYGRFIDADHELDSYAALAGDSHTNLMPPAYERYVNMPPMMIDQAQPVYGSKDTRTDRKFGDHQYPHNPYGHPQHYYPTNIHAAPARILPDAGLSAQALVSNIEVPAMNHSYSGVGSRMMPQYHGAAQAGNGPHGSRKYEDFHTPGYDTVYTDGVCKGNGKEWGTAGVGVWWGPSDPRNISERCPGAQTNNRAELIAIVRVLETARNSEKPLMIKSDSKYSINCVKEWIYRWEANGWRTANGKDVVNRPLIRYLAALLDQRTRKGQKVVLSYVKAHVGIMGNEMADCLAAQGALFPEEEERDWDSLRRRLVHDESEGRQK